MGFILKDDQAQSYDELLHQAPDAAEAKGYAQVIQDVFCFNMTAAVVGTDVTRIYYATQVEADKLTGTGEEFLAGDFVYATSGSNFQSVTANPAGTIGVDYYFCGIAKKDANAENETVLIKFIGDEYNHADRAA